MANVQIYQLDNAGSDLDNSALLAMDIPNPDTSAASEVPYVTRKESIASLETQMLQTDEYTTALDTTSKSITGAINELNTNKADASDVYTKTQVDSALNNKQDKLNKGTLGSGVDLDTLYTNAVYYLAGATTTQHAPCSYGILEVIATSITLQRVTQVGPTGTSASQYERIYINNAWTTWRTITRS